jgi:hypothetical protein
LRILGIPGIGINEVRCNETKYVIFYIEYKLYDLQG